MVTLGLSKTPFEIILGDKEAEAESAESYIHISHEDVEVVDSNKSLLENKLNNLTAEEMTYENIN